MSTESWICPFYDLQSSQFSKMLFSTVKVMINASVTQGFHNVCTSTCIRGKALCTFRCSFREIIVVIRQFWCCFRCVSKSLGTDSTSHSTWQLPLQEERYVHAWILGCVCMSVRACVCVCVCVKKWPGSSKTRTLDSCFGLVGSHQQGAE